MTLTERVARLERENRRMRALVLAGLAVASLVVLLGQNKPRAEIVAARGFRVVDAEGRARAGLGLTADGKISLGLADGNGQIRAGVEVAPDGTAVFGLTDSRRQPRAVLLLDGSGASFRLSDAEGEERAGLRVTAEGSAELDLGGQNAAGSGLRASRDGAAFKLSDAQGRQQFGVVSSDVGPALSLSDPAGSIRLMQRVGRNGPEMLFLKSDGSKAKQFRP